MLSGRLRGIARVLTICTLCAFLVYGLVFTLFPLFPLWIDELTLVDNLKFKTQQELWSHLDHVQQFPRVYLQLLKAWCAALDYSYFSLRLPAFLVHCLGLLLLVKLSAALFGRRSLQRYAWVLLYLGYNTSIHYFFYVKQYTMEMALGLVGIWQLMELMKPDSRKSPVFKMPLVCLGFLLGPFFSYTYPIVIAPIYFIFCLDSWQSKSWNRHKILPLVLGIVSVAAAYWIDVRQVLQDGGMQDAWKDMMAKSVNLQSYVTGIFMLFSNLGPGDVFGVVFGVIGVASLLYSTWRSAVKAPPIPTANRRLLQYCTLLTWLVIGLFMKGKLPLGSFRLTAFAVPAIGYLIIQSLTKLKASPRWRIAALSSYGLVILVSVGGTFATMGEVFADRHRKQIRMYQSTGYALTVSKQYKLPLFVTSDLAYPYEGTEIASWVLRTHPAFKVESPVRYRMIETANDRQHAFDSLTDTASTAILLDGVSVTTIRR